jgi:MFS transporter, YNFM family, putative membrane transport protein
MIVSPEIEGEQWIGRQASHEAATAVSPAALVALFIAGFATFVDLYVTQPLLPEFRQIFRASELWVSLTITAPVLAIALTAPILGLLADSVGRKRIIVAALFGLAIPTTLAATASSLGQFVIWRFLQGFFIPGIITVAIAYISEESPRRSVGSTMAIYVTGTVVGGFAGRFITGMGVSYWGWRADFIVLGAITLAGALATWRLLPPAPRFVRRQDAGLSLKPLLQHLRNTQLLATYAVGFNVLFCLVGAFTYVNFYLADKPFFLGPAALGLVFAVYLIGAVITPIAGRILDSIGYRRGLVGATGMVAGGMLLTLVHWVPMIAAGLAIASTGVFICQSAASSNVGKAAKEARSSAAGLYVALYYLGGCLGSVFPGFFWQQAGWQGCVGIIVCVQIITAALANRLWKD